MAFRFGLGMLVFRGKTVFLGVREGQIDPTPSVMLHSTRFTAKTALAVTAEPNIRRCHKPPRRFSGYHPPRSFRATFLQWKERRILAGGKPPGWCSSVSLDDSRLKETRTKSNSELDPGNSYQYSYRAERLPPKSPDPVPRPNRVRRD